jgi:hypothetical protein
MSLYLCVYCCPVDVMIAVCALCVESIHGGQLMSNWHDAR